MVMLIVISVVMISLAAIGHEIWLWRLKKRERGE